MLSCNEGETEATKDRHCGRGAPHDDMMMKLLASRTAMAEFPPTPVRRPFAYVLIFSALSTPMLSKLLYPLTPLSLSFTHLLLIMKITVVAILALASSAAAFAPQGASVRCEYLLRKLEGVLLTISFACRRRCFLSPPPHKCLYGSLVANVG